MTIIGNKNIQNLLKLLYLAVFLASVESSGICMDRGAIKLMLVPELSIFSPTKFCQATLQNFSSHWECGEVTFGTSLPTCLLCSNSAVYFINLNQGHSAAYVERHIERGHSLFYLHQC